MDAKPSNWTLRRRAASTLGVAAFIFGREDRKKVERQFDSGARHGPSVCPFTSGGWLRPLEHVTGGYRAKTSPVTALSGLSRRFGCGLKNTCLTKENFATTRNVSAYCSG